jgi:hypothetical protein
MTTTFVRSPLPALIDEIAHCLIFDVSHVFVVTHVVPADECSDGGQANASGDRKVKGCVNRTHSHGSEVTPPNDPFQIANGRDNCCLRLNDGNNRRSVRGLSIASLNHGKVCVIATNG